MIIIGVKNNGKLYTLALPKGLSENDIKTIDVILHTKYTSIGLIFLTM